MMQLILFIVKFGTLIMPNERNETTNLNLIEKGSGTVNLRWREHTFCAYLGLFLDLMVDDNC